MQLAILWYDNDKQLDLELQDIEKYKDDSNKCYQAIRKIQSRKPQRPLVIFDSELNRILSLLNVTNETGDYPEEVRRGILTPLVKPPKKDEEVNVRPIILLSVLRKIIAIILIDQCWERIKNHIPLSQAAYQKGQVFTIKILAEKAITSDNYEIFLLFLDMSKAFDTVNRSKLMETRKNILTPSELYMMYLLINDVNVKIGDKVRADILTAIGICQGDCLSALLFILYLAHAIKPIPKDRKPDGYHQTLWSALDWILDRDKLQIEIDPITSLSSVLNKSR